MNATTTGSWGYNREKYSSARFRIKRWGEILLPDSSRRRTPPWLSPAKDEGNETA